MTLERAVSTVIFEGEEEKTVTYAISCKEEEEDESEECLLIALFFILIVILAVISGVYFSIFFY